MMTTLQHLQAAAAVRAKRAAQAESEHRLARKVAAASCRKRPAPVSQSSSLNQPKPPISQ
jgi:hypothetical protein